MCKNFFAIRFRIGAALCFALALGHLACLGFLWQAFDLYGITPQMQTLASLWQPLPYLITVAIALCFTIAGIYGLSYSGTIRRLPLQKWVVCFTCVVFLLRAVAGLLSLLSDFTTLELTSTLGATLLGLCYLPCRCTTDTQVPH